MKPLGVSLKYQQTVDHHISIFHSLLWFQPRCSDQTAVSGLWPLSAPAVYSVSQDPQMTLQSSDHCPQVPLFGTTGDSGPDADQRLSIAFLDLSVFPATLQSCASTLKSLDASHNHLNNLLALTRCTQLVTLVLDSNLFEDNCRMPHLPNLRCGHHLPSGAHNTCALRGSPIRRRPTENRFKVVGYAVDVLNCLSWLLWTCCRHWSIERCTYCGPCVSGHIGEDESVSGSGCCRQLVGDGDI